jgi:hypothetical protein
MRVSRTRCSARLAVRRRAGTCASQAVWPRISSAPCRKCGTLRSVRGTGFQFTFLPFSVSASRNAAISRLRKSTSAGLKPPAEA